MSSLVEIRDEIEIIIANTRTWLSSHGPGSKNPWPQREIEIKQRRLELMKENRDVLDSLIRGRLT